MVQDAISNYLGLQTESGFTEYKDIGMNNIVNDATDGDGILSMGKLDLMIMNGTDKFTTHQVHLNEIKLGGLNTFTHFLPLSLSSDFTVNNEFRMDKLSIEFVMTMQIWPSKITDIAVAQSTNDVIEETFNVNALEVSELRAKRGNERSEQRAKRATSEASNERSEQRASSNSELGTASSHSEQSQRASHN